jgi:hypothetical protein
MKILLIIMILFFGYSGVIASSIPEPGIVFFGPVENSAHGNGRMTVGSLTWTVTTPGQAPVTMTAPLTNLDGRFSYRLRFPYETAVGSTAVAPGSFILNAGPTVYTHGSILYAAGGREYPVSLVGPSLAVYNLSTATRGVIQALTLRVNAPDVLPGGGATPGLARVGVGSGSGPGYHPGDEEPWPFQFLAIGPHPEGGVVVEWTGAPVDRPYLLLRAQLVDAGLEEYEVVASFLASPAVSNSFRDRHIDQTEAYFYRLLVP